MYAYPWGLHDAGLDAAFADLATCGIEAVQVATSYHVGAYLNPRARSGPTREGDLGALWVDPGELDAPDWPFPPPVAEEVRNGAFSRAIAAAARRARIRLHVWVVFLYNHALARSRPELAVRNAWGAPHGAHLCPANPQVRAYAHALTRAALRAYRPESVHVESLSFLPFDYGWLNPKRAVEPETWARTWLGLCFCSHCRARFEAAGVDADGCAAAIRAWLERYLNTLPDGAGTGARSTPLGEPLLASDLQQLFRVRESLVLTLHQEVLALVHAAEARSSSNLAEQDEPLVYGAAADAVAALVTDVRVKVPAHAGADVEASLLRRAVQFGAVGARPTRFYPLADFDTEAALVDAVARARDAGIESHAFYEYSLLSRRQLTWIERASTIWCQ